MHDAILQATNREGTALLTYVREHGTFDDLPFDQIARAFRETYGEPS